MMSYPAGAIFQTIDNLFILGYTLLEKKEVPVPLKEKMATHRVRTVAGIMGQFFSTPPKLSLPLLRRIKLDLPQCLRERVLKTVVVYALRHSS